MLLKNYSSFVQRFSVAGTHVALPRKWLMSAAVGLCIGVATLGGNAQTSTSPTGSSRLGVQDYNPITGKERAKWFAVSTLRGAVGGSVFSAAWGTALGRPEEYPNTWEGFGRRYRMSLAGVVTGNAMEAGLGALWGEDPRYFRTNMPMKGNMKAKVKNVVVSTFTAKNRNGDTVPAYARYIAQPGNNFLANTWRVDSDATVGAALTRTAFGFLGRMTANAVSEFAPNILSRGDKNKDGRP